MKPASVPLNSSSSALALQTATAIIEAGAGLALLGFPSRSVQLLLGAELEAPAALTMARVAGMALLTLGVGFWLARGDSHSRAARGLLSAMTIYNVGVAFILGIVGIGPERGGIALWPAVALHLVMTAWCVAIFRHPSTGEIVSRTPSGATLQ